MSSPQRKPAVPTTTHRQDFHLVLCRFVGNRGKPDVTLGVDLLVKTGGVEICVSALRANSHAPAVHEVAVRLLEVLASTKK